MGRLYKGWVLILGQTLWVSIIHSKQSHKYIFCFALFVEFFSIFDLNIWWVLILQHRVLRILWQHRVTSHFAPLWVPLPLLGIHSSYFFSGLRQARLTPAHLLRVHVRVTCPDSIAPSYTPLLCAPAGAVLAPLSNVLVSHNFGVVFSILLWVCQLLEGMGCVFLSSVRSPAQDFW